ncbi:MAG: signal peptidase I [Negativibacillus sp.]|nr:signal peptidase I [Negativibacillus sp.]
MAKKNRPVELPTMEQIQQERKRLQYNKRYSSTLKSTVAVLIVVAALAILVATLWMPVFQIYGTSMSPALQEGEFVIAIKSNDLKTGDICALWYGNKLLVKRVIAGPGSWVDIDKDGNVSVDGKVLDEPYLQEKAFGDCDIELPMQVPDARWFVMGDNRATSADSRNSTVGCISEEYIVGRIEFCIWPLSEFGPIQ